MDLLCGLGVTERHRGQIFEDGHLHRAVAPIQQRHQGAGLVTENEERYEYDMNANNVVKPVTLRLSLTPSQEPDSQ
ncbi:hypothetical protein EYF80_026428 [Liparis tanakae]|uniref:Uncharacterized protein n=1 Tax=Liparis tanakae TaxID=230148 RepID=A0A4Z2HC49_9TELE|nr:hypothetical protein EYF80_026428 [Liparis tanakae]